MSATLTAMVRRGAATTLALAILGAGVARAADQPLIAPAAAWVVPAHVDLKPPKTAEGAAVGIILDDVQTRLTLDGEATYHEFIAKVQTPLGLTFLGSVEPSWDPHTDKLIIHKINIIRDGKVINVLAGGKPFTILRRETQLEEATLDGTLTAYMQLDGLRVGDIVDFALTVEQADPVLKGWVQEDMLLNGPPIAHLRARLVWPVGIPVHTFVSAWAGPLKLKTEDGVTSAALAMDDVPEVVLPKGAPARFQRGREIVATSFASWADVSALMAPLFEKAATLPPNSPLEAEVKKIAARSADPKVRAEAALALVQNQVRYVLLALDGGGLTPATADLTWSRRFGDCKGKTALLLALLKALGVEAEPALVSMTDGDGLDHRLPALLDFNHVIVHATISGKSYWIDGTRVGDTDLDAIRIPPYRWALPVRAGGANLVALTREPLTVPDQETTVHFDASAGIGKPAPAQVDIVLRGDAAVMLNLSLTQLTGAQIDQALKAFFSKKYNNIEPKSEIARFDPVSGVEHLTMDGTATLDWSGQGLQTIASRMVDKPEIDRRAGPHDDAPYAVNFPAYEASTEIVRLPDGGANFSVLGADVNETVGEEAFKRTAIISNGVFTLHMSERTLASEFPFARAGAVTAALTRLSDSGLFIAPHAGPSSGATAETTLQGADATTAQFTTLLESGQEAFNRQGYATAITNFDKAVALEPKSADALAMRSMSYARLGQFDLARADDQAALSLDERDENAVLAEGDLAWLGNKHSEAFVAYTQAIDLAPDDPIARIRRVRAYAGVGDLTAALADAEDALKQFPNDQALHVNRGLILVQLNRPAEAASEAAEIAASGPKDPEVQLESAQVLAAAGRQPEALAAADRAVGLARTAPNLVARVAYRAPTDLDGMAADATAALALDPGFRPAMSVMEEIEFRRAHYAQGRVWIDRLIKADPEAARYFAARGADDVKLGDSAQATLDFAAARRLGASNASDLNNLCWKEATLNFNVSQALVDCDTAVKLTPSDAQVLDSRAFVLLRLNRNPEAVSAYSAALAIMPELGLSLYGRSLAERRLGHGAKADRDLKAALVVDPSAADDYKSYGVTQ